MPPLVRNTFACLMLLLISLTCNSAAAGQDLTLGVLALRPLEETEARWQTLGDYLNEELPGFQVRVLALNYKGLEQALRQHKLDFILTTPSHYLQLKHRNALSGALATLVEQDGEVPVEAVAGVVFTRADRTDLVTLQDLEDQLIASCSPLCMEGYQLPVEAFIDAGLQPPAPENLTFLGAPHDKVVEAVLAGRADAGFVRAGVIEAMARDGKIDPRDIRVINHQDLPGFPYAVSTRLYPQWPVAALSRTDESIARRVAVALLRIESGTPLAHTLRIHGFSIPANYAAVDILARKLQLPPYDASPSFTLTDVWTNYGWSIVYMIFAVSTILVLVAEIWLSRRKLKKAQQYGDEQRLALNLSYAQLRTLVKTIPDLVWVKDTSGVYLACNPQFERLFGAPESDIVGKTDYDFVPRQLADLFLQKDQETIDSGKSCVNEEWVTFADDGRRALLETIKTPMRDAEGRLIGVLGIARDITKRRADEEKLRLSASVVEVASEAFMVTDTRGVIVAVNPAFTAITGFSEEEAVGQTPAILKSGRQDAAFYRQMWETLQQVGYWEGEIWDRRKDGNIYPKWLSINTVKDNAGVPTHYVGAFIDITERKVAEERIHMLAFYDPLTDLPNRRLLLDRLNHALVASTRSREYGALLFLDLDHFKTLNDTQGHVVGDQLLAEVGKRLTVSVREGDTVSRFGGDEFVVLLEGLSLEEPAAAKLVEQLAEKIHYHLNQPFLLDGMEQDYHTTASIGLTLFRGREASINVLLKQADLALYQAKEAGRNAIRFFDPAMQADIEERTAMETALRRGLEQNELVLFYQPLVGRDGNCIGAEALLRWLPPGRDAVSPEQFIPLAEETGLILGIGDWVLQRGCAQLKTWESDPAASGLTLSINISARQFRQPKFVEKVERLLIESEVDPKRLKFELTESAVLDNVEEAITRMTNLKALGIGLSLDDFGTGYSSLSYLKQLPVEEVKIDRSFVGDVPHDSNDAAIVRAILAMSDSLGLSVVAEGVETDLQFAYLNQYGCKVFQGYLFGRPMPIDDFTQYLKGNPSQNDS